MSAYKKDQIRKREKSLKQKALNSKKEHDKIMKGKKTILVPHPDKPRCWIEKIIEE